MVKVSGGGNLPKVVVGATADSQCCGRGQGVNFWRVEQRLSLASPLSEEKYINCSSDRAPEMKIAPAIVGYVAKVREGDRKIYLGGALKAKAAQKFTAIFFAVRIDFRDTRYRNLDSKLWAQGVNPDSDVSPDWSQIVGRELV